MKTTGKVVRDMDIFFPGGEWSEAVDGDVSKTCLQAFRCVAIGIGKKTDDSLDVQGRKIAAIWCLGEQRMPSSLFIIKGLVDKGHEKFDARSSPY